MGINATLINLFHVCPREMWLHANGINMEHNSDVVYDGKLLHENSYPQRAMKYTEMDISAEVDGISLSGKIDFYDSKERIIHETKRSDSVVEAHEWQAKFYIWLFLLNEIPDVRALLEYPALRTTSEVWLTPSDISYLKVIIHKIEELQCTDICPDRINSKICKTCSYFELCYIEE